MSVSNHVPAIDETTLSPSEVDTGSKLPALIQDLQHFIVTQDKLFNQKFGDLPDKEKQLLKRDVTSLHESGAPIGSLANLYEEGSTQREVVELYVKLASAQDSLEDAQESHKPILCNEVTQMCEDLYRGFQWDRVISYYDEEKDHRRVSSLIPRESFGSLTQVVSDFSNVRAFISMAREGVADKLSYQELAKYSEEVTSSRALWDRQGFIQTGVEASGPLEEGGTGEAVAVLRSEAGGIIDEMRRYQEVREMFRTGYYLSTLNYGVIPDILFSLNPERYDRNSSENLRRYGYDPRFLLAARNFTHKKAKQFSAEGYLPPSIDEENARLQVCRNVEVADVLSKARISGLQPREGFTLAITEEELRAELAVSVPAYFLPLIDIRFVDRPEESEASSKTKKPDQQIEDVGECTYTYDENGKLIRSTQYIYINPYISGIPNRSRLNYQRRLAEEVTKHEIAHMIHAVMEYTDMQEWVGVVEKDSTAVTEYVRDSKKIDKHKGIREDFCDSFSMCTAKPWDLDSLSHSRSEYIMAFLHRYMGAKQRGSFYEYLTKKFEKHTESVKRAEARAREEDDKIN